MCRVSCNALVAVAFTTTRQRLDKVSNFIQLVLEFVDSAFLRLQNVLQFATFVIEFSLRSSSLFVLALFMVSAALIMVSTFFQLTRRVLSNFFGELVDLFSRLMDTCFMQMPSGFSQQVYGMMDPFHASVM